MSTIFHVYLWSRRRLCKKQEQRQGLGETQKGNGRPLQYAPLNSPWKQLDTADMNFQSNTKNRCRNICSVSAQWVHRPLNWHIFQTQMDQHRFKYLSINVAEVHDLTMTLLFLGVSLCVFIQTVNSDLLHTIFYNIHSSKAEGTLKIIMTTSWKYLNKTNCINYI